jgi:hypothetical protein
LQLWGLGAGVAGSCCKMSTAMWALAFDRNGVYVVAKAASAWFPPKKLLSGEYAFFLGLVHIRLSTKSLMCLGASMRTHRGRCLAVNLYVFWGVAGHCLRVGCGNSCLWPNFWTVFVDQNNTDHGPQGLSKDCMAVCCP